MKTSVKKMWSGSSTVWRISLMAIVMMAFLASGNAMAAREKYVLDYGDSNLRSHRGESATLFLKKTLKEQYPWVDSTDLELRRVVLVAKSRHGRGNAQLRVGNHLSEMYRVDGRSDRFRNDRRDSFDRIHISNPSRDSGGPWQIDLQGDFVVNKVVLEVDDKSRRHRNQSWGYR